MIGKPTFKKPPFTLDRSRPGTLVEQVASALRTAVVTGYYRAGDMLPPTRDLAALLGVSRVVAIRAMRRLADERLVVQRPHSGSVVCAKDQPPWKGQVLVVVPPGLGNPHDSMIHAVVRDTLTAAGYLPTSATVPETRPLRFDDFSLLECMLRQQTDLVVQLHDQANITRWLSKCGVPFVRFADDDTLPPNCVGVVRRDFARALPDFVAHCRKVGVKSVLQVADILRADATDVLSRDGIEVSTLRTPAAMRNGLDYDFTVWAAETFAKRLAKGRGWLPDLIFFQNDHLATGALMALGAAGIHIPEDVRIATWANYRYGPAYFKPLTRMEMDNAAIGATLADCVLEYLKGGTFPTDVVVGPDYIRGETM